MRKLLLILFVTALFQVNAQPLLEISQIEEKYPNGIGAYFSENNSLLFDGGDFDSNSSDIDKVDYYRASYYEGDLMMSNRVDIESYCDSQGNILGFKRIRFIEYDKNASNPSRKSGKGKLFLVGTELEFWKSGRIKKISHN